MLPSLHAAAALVLAIAMFYGFASGRRPEIVSLITIGVIALGLYFFPITGNAPQDGLTLAFEGFGHHALITICALMILGRGLVVTGALQPATRILQSVWNFNKQLGLLITLCLALTLSMLINDTPVLVLLLPILVQLAAKGGMPASKTLIPVNSAILIGGMATTIGTSTNLLVVSIANDLGMRQISVFHFTDIVLIASLIALPYIWLVMPRLLPDNSVQAGHEPRDFEATLRFGPESSAAGSAITDMVARLPATVRVVSFTEGPIGPDSRITIVGSEEALEDAARITGSYPAPVWLMARLNQSARLEENDLMLVHLAIAPDSRLSGLTLQTAGLEGVAIVGIHKARRFHETITSNNLQQGFGEGDVLLALGTQQQIQEFARNDGLLMLEGGRDLPRSNKAVLALAIMAGAVGVASIGLVPIAISSLGGAVLMFVTGCVKFDRVGRALSAKVIVLVAASIALGKLVLVTGAAEWLGLVLASALQFFPAAAVLAAVMIFAAILTNFASNATAAAVGTPIAFSLANQLGLPPEPMVLAILFGCNLCYATPVAYQTNMMIMVEGDYKFADFLRTGLPLIAIMIASLSTLLVWRYHL